MHLRLLAALLLLLLSSQFIAALRIPTTQQSSIIMNGNDSTVLSELKETIRLQKAEIESLKKQVSSGKKPVPQSHGGHGAGGGEESVEELASYLSLPFYQIAMKRVGWLGIFLVSLSFTALIMNGFEHTLERQIELAYFVPLLAGHGGNTGGQAVGTVLSTISAGFVSLKDAPRVIRKEAMSGMLAGIILGSMVGPIAHYIMGISPHVSTVVACTIPLVSTIAATLGSTIPFVCIALGLDPSVIAGPAMTSFVDVCGLMSYFLIANQVFKLYGIEL